MTSSTLTVRVRPIRVAFLVDPKDRQALLKAIETNTCLWGGAFNPIIPVYERTPKIWEPHRVRHLIRPDQIIEGYLEAFDPDFVIPIGNCETRNFQIGHRQILRIDDLYKDISDTKTLGLGIGFTEILSYLVNEEFRFKRNDRLTLTFPKLLSKYKIFLASVFGLLPREIESVISTYYGDNLDVRFPSVQLDNFLENLDPYNLFPRRVTQTSLEYTTHREPQIFYCNANSSQDIIDYWNLRASGYYVVPIPVQVSHLNSVKKFAKDFIEENFLPYRNNPERYQHTTIQKSRSVSQGETEKFCDSLCISPTEKNHNRKYSLQWWYPRIWDEWARENTQEGVNQPYAYETDVQIADNQERLELRSYDPKIRLFSHYQGKPRFANEFYFRWSYISKEPMAEVFPEGSQSLSRAIGDFGFSDWRFSRSGPVFLAKYGKDLIFLDQPKAEAVMIEWLRERGWKATLSPSGRMASQLFKQLGGTWGIWSLGHKGLIEILGDLDKEGGMPWPALMGRLNKIKVQHNLTFDCGIILERLIQANAIKLGAKIQCPVCTRHNWYELNSLNYQLHCKFCLSNFDVPVQSPKNIEWSYRAHGPFAGSVSQGAFCVLLVLKFLIGRAGSNENKITPIFSYTAKKEKHELEADLTCLLRPLSYRQSKTYVVHAECKSFNGFQNADIKRMEFLASEFPGSILIFATFKESLSSEEVVSISKLVESQRIKRLVGQPNSQIIVLTGTELFSMNGIPECWSEKGENYEKFNQTPILGVDLFFVADATQQLYLNLPSWNEFSETNRIKKTRKNKNISNPRAEIQ